MTPEQWDQVKNVLAGAMEISPADRATYLDQSCGDDQVLRREVEHLLEWEPRVNSQFLNQSGLAQAAAAILVPEQDNRWIGRRVGVYHIVEQIGAGGMGEVYRAFRADDQYQKQVALKVIRTGHDSGVVITRFKNERQILATLEHPNIARLLDGGTTEEGTPYLVMELIEGQPIGEYCDTHKLPIVERLELFVQVCGAVQYAHQHLVIHRDIKPSNVLVTADGTPKLLDFGIAKVLEPDAQSQRDDSLTAFRALTPEYASPEQINGEPVTTAADVYSLGVVLYHLLTGRSPYPATARSSQELAAAICHREPDKPSTLVVKDQPGKAGIPPITVEQTASARGSSLQKLRKQLSGDLDNIVLMALRKEPSRRYSSAERLAEDVQRHLESRPVIARNDSLRYRASKFVVRHKRGVAVGMGVAAILLSAMFAILRESRVARVQRAKAERRFQDVRELANSLIFDVHDSIQDVPGTTGARKLIITKALHYLDSLEQESQDDPSLQRELAEAYRRIGDVQGNDFAASLGDTGSALNSYEKALAIRQKLWSAQRHSLADALALAESLRLVSQTHLFAGNLPPALESARKAVDLMEPIAQRYPKDGKVLLELLADYQSVANILGGESSLSSLGDNAAALEFRRKQLQTAEAFASLDPTDYKAQGNLAIAISTMGDQLLQDGQIAAPLQHYNRARSIFQDMIAHSTKAARARYLLDLVYQRLAHVHLAKSDVASALESAHEGWKISQQFTSADPRDVQSGATFAEDCRMLADLESRQGKNRQALIDIDKAIVRMQAVLDLSPKDAEMVGVQASLYSTAGDIASRAGNQAQALKFYESAIALLAKVFSENPTNAGVGAHLAATYNSVGKVYQQLHKTDAAEIEFHKSLAIAEPMATSTHGDAQSFYTVADGYAGLGEVEAVLASDLRQRSQTRLAHWRNAVAWYNRSLQAWNRIKEPGAISPAGFDCVPRESVLRRLSQLQSSGDKFPAANGKIEKHPR